MILVTGATGTVGGHLVGQLCRRGAPVRALVRARAKADDLRGYDCDVAVAAYEDRDALEEAMRGVTKVFLVAPAGERMAAQEAAVLDALPPDVHVVKLAASGFDDPPSRIHAEHAAGVARLRDAGVPYTVVAATSYLQNLLRTAGPVQEDGVLRAPAGDAQISHVDAADVAAVAAHVLTSDGHEGRTYTVTGREALTWTALAERLSGVLGREVRYGPLEVDEQRRIMTDRGLSPWLVDGLLETDEAFRQGRGSVVTDEVEKATGRPPRAPEEFFAAHLAAYR